MRIVFITEFLSKPLTATINIFTILPGTIHYLMQGNHVRPSFFNQLDYKPANPFQSVQMKNKFHLSAFFKQMFEPTKFFPSGPDPKNKIAFFSFFFFTQPPKDEKCQLQIFV